MKFKRSVTLVAVLVLLSVFCSCGNPPEQVISFEETEKSDEPESNVGEIFVYVCGAVNFPGVYGFLEGARVCDAISAAEGFTDNANRTYVNQAELLHDGDMIYIPAKDEQMPITQASSDGRININRASVEELTKINGIGKTRANAIISYREEYGAFSSTEEITKVSGIGESTYQKIKDTITIN